MIEETTSRAQVENAHHLIVAVQSASDVASARGLGNRARSSSHTGTHHRLQGPVGIGHRTSVAGHTVHGVRRNDTLVHDQHLGGLRKGPES